MSLPSRDLFEWLCQLPTADLIATQFLNIFSLFIFEYWSSVLNCNRPILITPARALSAPSHSHRRRPSSLAPVPRRVAVRSSRPPLAARFFAAWSRRSPAHRRVVPVGARGVTAGRLFVASAPLWLPVAR
jgi:hypothetical protein